MDVDEILARFDREVRQRPQEGPGAVIEREPGVVRVLGGDDGWTGITWSGLGGLDADAVIAEQVRRFAGAPWEWKLYSHDEPVDLAERLLDAGFEPGPPEALLVAEVAGLPQDVVVPDGVRLVPVSGADAAAMVVRVHDEVFGGDHSAIGRHLLERPDDVKAVVAVAGDRPICAGRIELHRGTQFASLWGGGTVEDWRGRGVFKALVAYRAAQAARAGYRYLQVDASDDSRPILQRLGFVRLATTTPFVHA
ncbi:GNAT family N-acetyltransferase [Dactylosporangium matsuzakiense]|uniref:N-acetyltransferase n=1 Tax=Dactylosporangium matsuzakiense TaxID=53360 RepID=A0A9W6KE27_9ACTN|nr:GNAT family N-acetyltransferase [Dactylosporangium matsuzakiense]UWZ46997.1 GNAT family N-acetyltransferase [Dactylosporangium matsuzakiense]GLK98580.1 N-acetyltransferase [Dactylosporangium matsuzakiense]